MEFGAPLLSRRGHGPAPAPGLILAAASAPSAVALPAGGFARTRSLHFRDGGARRRRPPAGSAAALAGLALALARQGRGERRRPCRGRLLIRGASPVETEEDLRALRTRELRSLLASAGLNVSSCFDRDSLLDLLQEKAALEKVLAIAKPCIVEVPFKEGDSYMSIDLALGGSGTKARFVVDPNIPFSMVDHSFAETARAVPVAGGDPTAQRGTFGRATLGGSLDCGELLAVPVKVPLPGGCQGRLSYDFLRRLDWEFDLLRGCARVACPDPSGGAAAAVPFDTEGLVRVPLEWRKGTMQGRDLDLLATTSAALRRADNPDPVASLACTAVLDLTSLCACSDASVTALGLSQADFIGDGKRVRVPGGMEQVVQQAKLTVVLGAGPEGARAQLSQEVCAGLFAQQLLRLGFTPADYCVVLGLDFFRQQKRVVLCPRLPCMWVPAE